MYKICFFVPLEEANVVKQALFDVGAGKIGDYDCCAWQTEGQGQFRALEGSQPYIGQRGEITYVPELKVEMVCKDALIKQAIKALLKAHPYEEPAYDIWRLADQAL